MSMSDILNEIGVTLGIIAAFLWAASGYYGAWLLLKKGYGAEFLSCLIIAGGTPIIVPAVLGMIMFLWGYYAKDKRGNKYTIQAKTIDRSAIGDQSRVINQQSR